MPAIQWFWIIFVISLLFGCYFGYRTGTPGNRWGVGLVVVIYVMIGLLGYIVGHGGPLR